MTHRDHFIFSISSSSESATKWLLCFGTSYQKILYKMDRRDCCSIAQDPAFQKAGIKNQLDSSFQPVRNPCISTFNPVFHLILMDLSCKNHYIVVMWSKFCNQITRLHIKLTIYRFQTPILFYYSTLFRHLFHSISNFQSPFLFFLIFPKSVQAIILQLLWLVPSAPRDRNSFRSGELQSFTERHLATLSWPYLGCQW